MELKKALQGLIIARTADGVSHHTAKVNEYGINKMIGFLNNPEIAIITKLDLQIFYISLHKNQGLSEPLVSRVLIRKGDRTTQGNSL